MQKLEFEFVVYAGIDALNERRCADLVRLRIMTVDALPHNTSLKVNLVALRRPLEQSETA